MSVKPMLGDWEIPRVADMQTLEQRSMVELNIPGQTGSVYQDMNSLPMQLMLSGSLYGSETNNDFLEQVREKYQEGAPVTFVSDIVTGTELQYVVIETMAFQINARNPEQLDYFLTLKESPPPPPPSSSGFLDGLDTSLLDEAGALVDSVSGALDALDALGNIPDFGDPSGPLESTLDEVDGIMSDLGDIASSLGDLFS
ncbi:MAG: hypothetical protein MI976_02075 [Pseudomonadales bacterium]|nr:hypothetical protein [Pseudomonadales bacterium]